MIEKETILEFLCRKELEKFLERKLRNDVGWRKIFFNNNLEDYSAEEIFKTLTENDNNNFK